ncbi:MAG: ABC transporter ATP-binding protein [Thaumarchaeota archaeon]|nr:ABC transporter ATP-binding protein [Candidatus Calditenuaceae archaeon]
MSDTKIRVESITHGYSIGNSTIEALKDVSLNVRQGEFFTIIGPSGCGKSTLLNIIAGLIRPTSGKVFVDGTELKGPMPGKLAYVFQQPLLLPWRTVLDNVAFGLEMQGLPKKKRVSVGKQLVELVGLRGFEYMYPGELSGGMQQRVAIARALAVNPDVLLMDEPFGALDEQTRLQLGIELTKLWMVTKKTIVFVTHSLSEAAFLSDRIAVMRKRPGSIIGIIEVNAERPRDPESPEIQKVRSELWKMLKEQGQENIIV